MISEREFKTLINYQDPNKSALTIYLQTSPVVLNIRSTKIRFKNLIKTLTKEEKKRVHKEINGISTLLQSSPPKSKGIAIFSSNSSFFVYPLPMSPLQDMIEVSNRWLTYPLGYIKQFYPVILLTVVHEKEASLYSVGTEIKHLLTIKQKEKARQDRLGFFGRAGVIKGKGGGTAERKSIQLENIHTFLKETSAKIQERIDSEKKKLAEEPIVEIIVGEGNALKFYSQYTKNTIPLQVSIIQKLIGWEREDRLRDLCYKTVARSISKTVENIVSSINIGNEKSGIVGASDVVSALQQSRVQTLLISISNPIPGSICGKCGYITLSKTKRCPSCRAKTAQKDDIKEEIYRKGLETADNVVLTKRTLPNKTQFIATFRY